jgi:hypothetical protein
LSLKSFVVVVVVVVVEMHIFAALAVFIKMAE